MDLLLVEPLIKQLSTLLLAWQRSLEPLHGKVIFPASRAYHLVTQGKLSEHHANELEGGKGFPAMLGHLQDPDAPDDVASREPPWEGEIASGGKHDERAQLNEVRDDWPKFRVDPNVQFKVEWHSAAAHKTRRWSYWLTQPGWDSSQPLRREHFGDAPVKVFLNTFQPYWQEPQATRELVPPTYLIHEFDLPERHGYHVLLAVWDVADTFSAFYQVIDLQFD